MKSRIVTGVLIEKNGAYLFGRKNPNIGPYPNTWVMIGGGIRLESESIEQGLRREVKEECNIEIIEINKLSFDEDQEPDKDGIMTHYIFLVFTAKYSSGNIKPGDDIVELKWINKKDFSQYPLPRPTVKLFKEIGWL